MVGAGAHKRQAERDVHPLVKGVELERDEPLVVIHAEHAIEFPFGGAKEQRVRRNRPGERGAPAPLLRQTANGRGDDFDFFAAHRAGFACVGIEPRHRDPYRLFASQPRAQKVGEQRADAFDLGAGHESRNLGQRDVRCDERHRERAAGEQHGEVFNPGASGKKLGLAGKRKADRLGVGFVDGAGDDGVDLARDGKPGGFLKRRDSSARGVGGRLAGDSSLGAPQNAVPEARIELAGFQRRMNDLGADSGAIPQGDANGS